MKSNKPNYKARRFFVAYCIAGIAYSYYLDKKQSQLNETLTEGNNGRIDTVAGRQYRVGDFTTLSNGDQIRRVTGLKYDGTEAGKGFFDVAFIPLTILVGLAGAIFAGTKAYNSMTSNKTQNSTLNPIPTPIYNQNTTFTQNPLEGVTENKDLGLYAILALVVLIIATD